MSRGGSQQRLLIVNADDLGLHEDIDRGIETAHREGVVTSASISAVGERFEGGVDVCRRCPELDVGVHLTLIGERPLSDLGKLGGLVDGEGRFVPDHRVLITRVLSARVSSAAVRRELDEQIRRVRDAGLRPTHLDSHQHVHVLPGIWPVVVQLAKEHGIDWVRVPAFAPLGDGQPGAFVVALRWGLNMLQRVRRGGLGRLRTSDVTPALGLSGHLTVERILSALAGVPNGALAELVTHPGVTTSALAQRYRWGFEWSKETAALTDPRLPTALRAAGFTLRGFAGPAV